MFLLRYGEETHCGYRLSNIIINAKDVSLDVSEINVTE